MVVVEYKYELNLNNILLTGYAKVESVINNKIYFNNQLNYNISCKVYVYEYYNSFLMINDDNLKYYSR